MSLLDRLRAAVSREQFDPRALGVLVNPFYFARQGQHEAVSQLAPEVRGKILDVGCGSKPYRALFDATEYVGMDIQQSGHEHTGESIDVFYDGKTFPFGSGSFDAAVCFQVLEHVFEPQTFLDEINRVLRPRGMLLLTVPFVWDEHEQPYDYARYSSFGLQHLLEQHGFELVSALKSCADVRVPFQLLNAYIFKLLPQKNRLSALASLCMTAPVTVAGLAAQRLFPDNQDLYLDNVILARKRGG